MQDRIMALFPKNNGDTKQLVPRRERGPTEEMRCPQMLISPVGEISDSPVGGEGGIEATIGKMILWQPS